MLSSRSTVVMVWQLVSYTVQPQAADSQMYEACYCQLDLPISRVWPDSLPACIRVVSCYCCMMKTPAASW